MRGDDGLHATLWRLPRPARHRWFELPARSNRHGAAAPGHWDRRMLALVAAARLAIAAVGAAALAVLWGGSIAELPWLSVALLGTAVVALTASTVIELRRSGTRGPDLFAAHLLLDVLLLTYAFRCSGGLANPLIVLFLLPLALAFFTVSRTHLLGGVALVVFSLAFLHFGSLHGESPTFSSGQHEALEVIGTVLVVAFAYGAARIARARSAAEAAEREGELRAHGARAIGGVAVQAADAIMSPLATMQVLVHELRNGRLRGDEQQAALDELANQIARCEASLVELLATAGHPRGNRGERRRLDAVLEGAFRQCELMNPALQIRRDEHHGPMPAIVDDRSLFDALVLLIQRVARRPPHVVRVTAGVEAGDITLCLCEVRSGPDIDTPSDRESECPLDESDASIGLATMLLNRFECTLRSGVGEAGVALRLQIPLRTIGADTPPASAAGSLDRTDREVHPSWECKHCPFAGNRDGL